MQTPKSQVNPLTVTPSPDFNKAINELRLRSPQSYNAVIAAQAEIKKSPEHYTDQALRLGSHTDELQLWLTVKGVRLLIRYNDNRYILDQFILISHLI
jgi:hypothetical protein